MDYKIVLMQNAEEDLDRFITYLLFEKKSEQAVRNLLIDFENSKLLIRHSEADVTHCLSNKSMLKKRVIKRWNSP
jgi:hypothetical protein